MRFLLLLSAAVWTSSALATPAQVMIIRHAEKPEQGNELSEKGRRRAEALVDLFTRNSTFTEYGPPIAIYAAEPLSEGGSLRPTQTVEPLAHALALQINASFNKKQFQQLADEILRNPQWDRKAVLISWVHDQIPDLAAALGVEPRPGNWKGVVFDRVWKIDFTHGKAPVLYDLPQRILPGDSQN